MAPIQLFMLVRDAFLVFERAMVARILRSPTFHHGVRRIHRTVEDIKYGRDPNEPLRPGEATEDPTLGQSSFMRHFLDELKTQFRGTKSNRPPPPSTPSKK